MSDPHTLPLAAFDLSLDGSTASAQLTPVRLGEAIGDHWSEVGVTSAFNRLFGDHFTVESVTSEGPTELAVIFRTTHPFAPDKRPDLAIFNLKLWVVSRDISPIPEPPPPSILVTNADGYGAMWGTTHPAFVTDFPPIQPYVILHPDATSAPYDWQNPAGWNVFAPGQESIDTVHFELGSKYQHRQSFRLLLTGDYGQSAVRATRQNPVYSLPEFAGEAPWRVLVTTKNNNLIDSNPASQATFHVDVWDWKNGLGLNSDVTRAAFISNEIAGTDPVEFTLTGSGREPDLLTGEVTIANAASATQGSYYCVVEIDDEATGSAIQDDLSTIVAAGPYRTFQAVMVDVAPVPSGPTAVITLCASAGRISPDIAERFDGGASLPGTSPIVAWEWDFEYDGSTFDLDATGTTVQHGYSTVGTHTVGLRVRDANSLEDIETIEMVVGGVASWQPSTEFTSNLSWEGWGSNTEPSRAVDVDPEGLITLVYSELSLDFTVFTVVKLTQLSPCADVWSEPETVWSSAPGTVAPSNVSVMTTPGLDGSRDIHVTTADDKGSYLYVRRVGSTWLAPINIPPRSTTGTWLYGTLARTGADTLGFIGVNLPTQPDATTGDGVLAVPAHIYASMIDGASFLQWGEAGRADVVTSLSGEGRFTAISPSAALVGTEASGWIAAWESLKTPYDGLTEVPQDAP
ncbi:MAG: PKD domain-containing protein, partial [bacterium]